MTPFRPSWTPLLSVICISSSKSMRLIIGSLISGVFRGLRFHYVRHQSDHWEETSRRHWLYCVSDSVVETLVTLTAITPNRHSVLLFLDFVDIFRYLLIILTQKVFECFRFDDISTNLFALSIGGKKAEKKQINVLRYCNRFVGIRLLLKMLQMMSFCNYIGK